MKFEFFNDTGREISLHPATFTHGCKGDESPIQPLELRTFQLPKGTYPFIKMWDYNKQRLSLLVSPRLIEEEEE